MRRLTLLVLLLVPAAQAHADGCAPSTCGISGAAIPGSSLLLVRPSGMQGPLVAYDLTTHRRRFALPPGMLSADGRWFYAASTRGTVTRLTRYDARTGRGRVTWSHVGRWWPQGMTSDGSQIVLFRFGGGGGASHFGVVAHGRLVQTLALRGNYAVETLSPNGRLLFLVHYDATGGYALERYDLRTSTLRPNPAREVDGSREKMIGQAWTAVATRDGRWLLTLYVKPEGGAFVHALDLTGGTPICVDLPWRGDYNTLQLTSLALSPDDRALYVANARLGVVSTIDVRRPHVAKTVHFRRWRGRPEFGTGPASAVARDGSPVVFTQNGSVWRYDVAGATVTRLHDLRADIAALAFAPSGKLVALLGLNRGWATVP